MTTERRRRSTPIPTKKVSHPMAGLKKAEISAKIKEKFGVVIDAGIYNKTQLLDKYDSLQLKGGGHPGSIKSTKAPISAPASSPRSETILIANQHTGGITFPRRGQNGVQLPPVRLAPGQASPVDRNHWNELKKLPVVQHYLDRGLLAEARKPGAVPVLDSTSTELPIPEHLQAEEQAGQAAPSSAKVRREKVGSIDV